MGNTLTKITINPLTNDEIIEILNIKNQVKKDGTPSQWIETDKGKVAVSTLNKPRKIGETAIIVGNDSKERLRNKLINFTVLWCRERLKNDMKKANELKKSILLIENISNQIKKYIESNTKKEIENL